MADKQSQRLPTLYVVALVCLPIAGLVLVGSVAAGGWMYYKKRHTEASMQKTPASSAPALDLNGAVMALRSKSTPETKLRALAALEQQAKSGNAKAMVMTAACYRVGLGTAADDQLKAFEWYQKAAQAGDAVAMLEMSRYYAEGVWVEASVAESKRWLERAANTGSAEAKWQLGEGK